MWTVYATCAAVLKALRARSKLWPIQTTSFSSVMRKVLTKIEIQTASMLDSCVLTLRMPPLLRQPIVAGGQTWWTTGHWECLPPSSPYCNSLDYFMWCVFEREVSKCPHITLTLPQGHDLSCSDWPWQGGHHSHLHEVSVLDWGCYGDHWGFYQINVYIICI